MTGWGLAMKGLVWHGRSYLAVGASIATTCAVICGALLVGDSVRESLHLQAIERLGRTRHALVSPAFFREELASELDLGRDSIPLILLRGSVIHPDTRLRSSEVNIIGVDARFSAASPHGRSWVIGSRDARVNSALASEVGAKQGDDLLVSFELHSDIPREHALGKREDTIQRLRLSLAGIEEDSGTAIFDLKLQQETPRNIFVSLERLQAALGREAQVNTIIVCRDTQGAGAGASQGRLRAAWKLDDIGAVLRADSRRNYVSLESRNFLLDSRLVEAARAAASESPYQRQEVLTYIANAIVVGKNEIPYSLVTSVSPWRLPSGAKAEPPLGPFGTGDGFLDEAGIVLNSWAAADLEAVAGNKVTVKFYVIGAEHELVERSAVFHLQGIVQLLGPALDPGWTPEYPGVSDAETFSDWDPPFPLDHSKIREPGPDGDYWKEFRTTPKGFIHSSVGERLWAGKYGQLTSFRIKAAGQANVDSMKADFSDRLRRAILPEEFGLNFRDIRKEAEIAARSGTDFGMLFISMSFFIIVAGLMLTSMTLRLSLEKRSKTLGMLGAVGFDGARIRGVLAMEGAIVIFAGSLAGLLGGVGYAALLIRGLKSWWQDAVNSPFLSLHVANQSLAISLGVTMALSAATGYFVLKKLTSLPPRRLLSGMTCSEASRSDVAAGSRRRLYVGLGLLALSMVFITLAWLDALPAVPSFLGMGTALLAAGMVLFSWALRASPTGQLKGAGAMAMVRLGLRNGRRAGGRSLLTAGLISIATFVVVTVAAYQRDPAGGDPEFSSGDGGFSLVGRSASPVYARLETRKGREELGLDDELSNSMGSDGFNIFSLRERPGDETSCLNLYRPTEPRILGAPRGFIERGGFSWGGTLAGTVEEHKNPWILLERTRESWPAGTVPAIGDLNTVQWILHSGLGKDITIKDGRGRDLSLRIVGLLTNSLFQGSLVVSNQNFEEMFPGRRGWSTFFIETEPKGAESLRGELEDQLGDFGLDLQSSGQVLSRFNRVQNTYLSTFMVLGGLGLLLGTIGLGAVLMRNVNDRRGELALMKALGYSGKALSLMVLAETLFLIIFGEIQGAVAALIAAAPLIASSHSQISWGPLALILAAVLAGGAGSCLFALRAALRTPVLGALRSD